MQGLSAIVAVVPAYRPATDVPSRLRALAAQVPGVVVVDDGSPCTFDAVLRACGALDGVTVVRHEQNRGIAAALNTGLNVVRSCMSGEAAQRDSPSTGGLLTVDQDTDLPPGYVASLSDAWSRASQAGLRLGALAAGEVRLADTRLSYRTRPIAAGLAHTDEVLQSGTVWSLDALADVGGFDESLVIDGVDTEMCLRLSHFGWLVAVDPAVSLDHRLGHSAAVRILGREVLATGHSPQRRYYSTRNRLRLLPQHLRSDPVAGLVALRRLSVNAALGLARDGHPSASIVAMAAGVRDAVLGRTGPRPRTLP